MNSLFKNMQINQLSGRLRQIAGTPNVLSIDSRRSPEKADVCQYADVQA